MQTTRVTMRFCENARPLIDPPATSRFLRDDFDFKIARLRYVVFYLFRAYRIRNDQWMIHTSDYCK